MKPSKLLSFVLPGLIFSCGMALFDYLDGEDFNYLGFFVVWIVVSFLWNISPFNKKLKEE